MGVSNTTFVGTKEHIVQLFIRLGESLMAMVIINYYNEEKESKVVRRVVVDFFVRFKKRKNERQRTPQTGTDHLQKGGKSFQYCLLLLLLCV